MRIIRIVATTALIAVHFAAYSQFNTVRKVKILPEIQPDIDRPDKSFPSLTVFDSARFKQVPRATVSMPLSKMEINSNYGDRVDPLTGNVKFHAGIDFKGASDSVRVIMAGVVKKVAYSRGLGNYIEVEHGDFKTTYGHLAFVMVREQMKLEAGRVIGVIGSTGRSTGNHLHFAIKFRGININPTPFLDLIYQTLELNTRKKTTRTNKD